MKLIHTPEPISELLIIGYNFKTELLQQTGPNLFFSIQYWRGNISKLIN